MFLLDNLNYTNNWLPYPAAKTIIEASDKRWRKYRVGKCQMALASASEVIKQLTVNIMQEQSPWPYMKL